MKEVFVSLGANLGDAKQTIEKAIADISAHSHITQLRISKLYRMEAPKMQPDYLSAVISFWTELSPQELLSFLQVVSARLGTVPLSLDLNILFYGTEQITENDLIIPHPRIFERLFILLPLSDLKKQIGSHAIDSYIEVLQKEQKEQNDRIEILEDELCSNQPLTECV